MARQTAEQFLERPPKTLAPLYVIYGAEPLGALEAADHLRLLARQAGHTEREIFTAEPGFDWQHLTAASSALSLFSEKRLLELRIPTGKPGKEGSAAIEAFCQRPPQDTVSLILLPDMDWKAKQSSWFSALQSCATEIEAMAVDRAALPRWLAGRLARQQQSANPDALNYLADRVEGNLLAAWQEVKKLALLCPPGEITMATLEAAIADVSRFSLAELTAAIHVDAAHDKAGRIQRVLDGLNAEGEPLPLVLWVLTNELRAVMRAKGLTRAGRPPHASRAREIEASARQHTAASLMRLNLQAAKIDRMIKGLDSNAPWDAFSFLACGLAGVKSPLARHAL